jgi:hypothetical protein
MAGATAVPQLVEDPAARARLQTGANWFREKNFCNRRDRAASSNYEQRLLLAAN